MAFNVALKARPNGTQVELFIGAIKKSTYYCQALECTEKRHKPVRVLKVSPVSVSNIYIYIKQKHSTEIIGKISKKILLSEHYSFLQLNNVIILNKRNGSQ